MSGHIRGWHVGARVEVVDRGGVDVCRVFKTSGSSGHTTSRLLAEYTDKECDSMKTYHAYTVKEAERVGELLCQLGIGYTRSGGGSKEIVIHG